MIFLDTDIVSYYFSGNINIRNKIMETIQKGDPVCMTSINVYEILKGYRWHESKNKESIFKQFLEKIPVFSLDDEIIELAADIYADLRKNGKTVGDADILIAAIVIMNRGTLISNNTKHYEHIKKLDLINWLE